MKALARRVKHQLYELKFKALYKKYLSNPKRYGDDPHFVEQLVRFWGNSSMAAGTEYAEKCIELGHLKNAVIFECGSGLSSLLVAGAGKENKTTIYTFEDHADWARKMQQLAELFQLSNLNIYYTPLKDYGSFEWYDLTACNLPQHADVVLCDGPPGTTKGGRYGLFPVLQQHFSEGTAVVLDDFNRAQEKEIAELWKQEFGFEIVDVVGKKAYAVLKKKA